MRAKSITGCLAVVTLALCVSAAVHAQPSGEAREVLRAGAVRIDNTPRRAQLPGSFTGVLDPIFGATWSLDNGSTRAALVAIDAGAIPTDLYDNVSKRAAAELKIPASQLLISASHTHSVPFRLDPGVEETILRSLHEAVARLQPAQLTWGTGLSYINVNRDRIDPKTQGWWTVATTTVHPTRRWQWSASRRRAASRLRSTTTTPCMGSSNTSSALYRCTA